MSTTIYMRPLSRLWAMACQAHMLVALDGNKCCVASLEAKLPRRPVLLPFFPLPLIRPLTNGGFSPSSSHRTPPHLLFLGIPVTI